MKQGQLVLKVFCLLVISFHLLSIVFWKESFFREQYDVSYWQDRFEHSQWSLPLSQRSIGDDGLYAYVGYRLILGDNPALTNAEMPPLGKYFIGLSILFFKNPAFGAYFFGLGSLLLFYCLANKLLGSSLKALCLVTLFSLEPLFFTQFWKAWLDIIQLFFLLLNLVFFVSLLEKRRKSGIWLVLFSGLSLGFFFATKTPIFFPLVFILEMLFFVIRGRKKEGFVFSVSVVLAIIISYFRYFSLGFSLIDFLKFQKYVLLFYLSSGLEVQVGAIWQMLFLGQFPDLITKIVKPIDEWWFCWLGVGVLGIIMAFWSLLKKNDQLVWRGVALFVLIALLVYSFIPVYPRYLLVILPFLYLLVAKLLIERLRGLFLIVLFLIVSVSGVFHGFSLLKPSPDIVLANFYYNFSHQYFQDIYQENLANESKLRFNRDEFREICQRALQQASVKAIEVEKIQEEKIRLVYKTQDLGSFEEEKRVQLVKEANQWKIKWDWDILLMDFLPGYQVETRVFPGKRGTITSNEGVVLARDVNSYLISISPEQVDTKKEDKMLALIAKFGDKQNDRGGVSFYNGYQENVLQRSLVPLVTMSVIPTEEEVELLKSYPGVFLTNYSARVYNGLEPTSIENTFYKECCTRIYSRYNYHGVKGIEKEYDKVLFGYDGGRIVIKNEKGEIIRVVLEKMAKIGQDITVLSKK